MTINSLYHLVAMVRRGSADLKIAKTFLMIPDLLNFWLTGRKELNTPTPPSSVNGLHPKAMGIPMLARLSIPQHIFPEIIQAGQYWNFSLLHCALKLAYPIFL